MIDLLLLYLALATTFTISKSALTFSTPIMFVAVRMIVAGLLLLTVSRAQVGRITRISFNDIWLFVRVILFHIFFAYYFEFLALSYIASAVVALAYNLSPFITALLAFFLYDKRITVGQLCGLGIGFLGVIPLLYQCVEREQSWLPCSWSLLWPYLILLLAVGSACYGWLLVQQLVRSKQYSPLLVNGWAMLIGGLLSGAIAMLTERAPFVSSKGIESTWIAQRAIAQWLSPTQLTLAYLAGCLSALVLVSNVIFYNAYGFLLRRYSATLLSFAGITTPFFAALLGMIFLDESFSVQFVWSALLTMVGVAIFYSHESTQNENRNV